MTNRHLGVGMLGFARASSWNIVWPPREGKTVWSGTFNSWDMWAVLEFTIYNCKLQCAIWKLSETWPPIIWQMLFCYQAVSLWNLVISWMWCNCNHFFKPLSCIELHTIRFHGSGFVWFICTFTLDSHSYNIHIHISSHDSPWNLVACTACDLIWYSIFALSAAHWLGPSQVLIESKHGLADWEGNSDSNHWLWFGVIWLCESHQCWWWWWWRCSSTWR